MSVEGIAKSCGYRDFNQVVTRTAWTCGALAIGSIASPYIFRGGDVKTHLCFSLIQGATFQLTLHNDHLKNLSAKLKDFDPEKIESMEKTARVIQFTLVTLMPLILAKTLTSWIFEPISRRKTLAMGFLYNGAVLISSVYVHDFLLGKIQPES